MTIGYLITLILFLFFISWFFSKYAEEYYSLSCVGLIYIIIFILINLDGAFTKGWFDFLLIKLF